MMVILSHVLAAYVVLASPLLGYYAYQKARKKIASGALDAKVGLYREIAGEQVFLIVAVLLLWRGGLSASSLGLIPPRSWLWTMAALFLIVVALAWSSLRLRPKAEKIRSKLKDSLGTLLPDSHKERFWFGAISIGAGVSEELAFRGFLLYYLILYLPHLNAVERVLLVSISFGLAHIYQGWKGAVGAGILGMVLALLYLASGSLLLPVLVHAALDLRVLLMFPPTTSPAIAKGHA